MNLRTNNQKGFTIVELLIVIVVIAILAAISIVAYTGIQNNARTSAAQSAAASVRDVAEAFNSVHGRYPTTKAEFTAGAPTGATETAVAKLPGDITFVTAAPTSAPTTPKTVRVVSRGPASPSTAVNGFIIYYWDYKENAVASVTTGVTTGTDGGTDRANLN